MLCVQYMCNRELSGTDLRMANIYIYIYVYIYIYMQCGLRFSFMMSHNYVRVVGHVFHGCKPK